MESVVKNKKRLSLFLLVIIVSMCFGAFASFTIKQVRTVLLDEEIQKLSSVADNQVNFIEILLDSYRDKVRLVATRTRLRKLLDEYNTKPDAEKVRSMRRILNDAINNDPDIDLIVIFNPSLKPVISTNSATLKQSDTERELSLGPAPKSIDQSRLTSFRQRDHIFLSVTTPIKLNGRIIGLLQARLKPLAISRNIESILLGESGEVVLGQHDPEGGVMFVTGTNKFRDAMAQKLADSTNLRIPMVQAFLSVGNTLFIDSLDYKGTPVVAVTRHIEELGWGLVVKIDRAEVFAIIGKIQFTSILTASVLVMLTIFITYLYGRKIEDSQREQKLALERRQLFEKRFMEVFNAASNAMMIVDQKGMIVKVNDQCPNLLGYASKELVNMPVENLVPKKLRSQHRALREHYSSAPTLRIMGEGKYFDVLRQNGETIPASIDLRPIELDQGSAVIATLFDKSEEISAKHNAEQHTAELARSNEDLGQFAYVASHDLKAPLRGISQLAKFIEEDSIDCLSDESKKDLSMLRNRAARMEQMLDSLLQYSRIGQAESAPVEVDLKLLVEEVASLYLPAEKFELKVIGDLPSVIAPRTAVEIVFRNLLMNSAKHHDLKNGVITIQSESTDKHLLISIIDDGPGIPSEYAKKVFELFQTLKSRDQVEGSGMGLALVEKVMKTLGGSVNLVPKEGRGACFRLEWPVSMIANSIVD